MVSFPGHPQLQTQSHAQSICFPQELVTPYTSGIHEAAWLINLFNCEKSLTMYQDSLSTVSVIILVNTLLVCYMFVNPDKNGDRSSSPDDGEQRVL